MFLDRVRRAVRRHALLDPGEGVVVAVSGGPDSVALLHALALLGREAGWKLHAAHLHHGIRGADADADEEFVRALAARLAVSLRVGRLDPAVLRGAGIEARARRARYAFLHEVAREARVTRIATGHTRDDQAETVLLRLLRGSGARGLSGIQPKREDGVIRPLLLASRAEVIAFLRRGKVAYREDASNRDPRFLRNRVRHELLPLLRALSPRIDERLSALADAMRADADLIERETERARREGGMGAGGPLDRASLLALPEAIRRRILGDTLRAGGAPPDRVATAIVAILDALAEEGTARSILLRGRRVARVGPKGVRVALAEDPPKVEAFDLALAVPGITMLPDGRAIDARKWESEPQVKLCRPALRAGPPASRTLGEDSGPTAVFDATAVRGPLRVRSRLPGDRIRPRGFGGTRKVQDLLTEARIPRAQRDRVPIVVMGGEILWVAGVRASQIAAPTANSECRLELSLRPTGSEKELGEAGSRRMREVFG